MVVRFTSSSNVSALLLTLGSLPCSKSLVMLIVKLDCLGNTIISFSIRSLLLSANALCGGLTLL